mmetsp:Transcript_28602/g.72780  ORF Transcript_28602/g.72780 Transcript_28602/m.72780 type:complete len:202 (+) Transcript_28602:814-1419(+)
MACYRHTTDALPYGGCTQARESVRLQMSCHTACSGIAHTVTGSSVAWASACLGCITSLPVACSMRTTKVFTCAQRPRGDDSTVLVSMFLLQPAPSAPWAAVTGAGTPAENLSPLGASTSAHTALRLRHMPRPPACTTSGWSQSSAPWASTRTLMLTPVPFSTTTLERAAHLSCASLVSSAPRRVTPTAADIRAAGLKVAPQ